MCSLMEKVLVLIHHSTYTSLDALGSLPLSPRLTHTIFGHIPYTPDLDCCEENVRDERSHSGVRVTYFQYPEWRESMSDEMTLVRNCHLAILEAPTRDLMVVAGKSPQLIALMHTMTRP